MTLDFYEVLRRRRMVRNYTDRPVDPQAVLRIVKAARKSPSAGFAQGQAFVVVTGSEKRKGVADAAGEQRYVERGFEPWVSRAAAIVVILTSEEAYRRRYGEPDKSSSQTRAEWAVPYWYFDAGAAAMALLLGAVAEGLAAGFLGLTGGGRERVGSILGIPGEMIPVGLVTIGYPAPDRRSASLSRGWKPEEEVIHWDHWEGG